MADPTDSERERNREQLRQRLAKAPDARTERANRHVEAGQVAERITGFKSRRDDDRYHSFLAGWDAALEMSQPELLKEMEAVRAHYDELVCERFQAEKLLPDLLAALEKAVAQYGKPGGPWNVPSEPGSWIAEARAALAEALGETP